MIARKTQKIIYNILILCFLIGGATYVCSRFIHLGNIEYTDNAQVKQHITPINTRVPGFIKKICFEEYQQVRKGDTLVIIEDAEFCLRVAQAEADLANATAGRQATTIGIATTQNNLSVSDASIEEVRVQMENAKRELNRFEKLLQEDAVTKQQYDNVHTAYETAKARYEQVSRAKQSTSLVKSEQTHRLGQNEAGVRLAEAALELARLNLSYTVIIAPCDGTTGKKEILEGQLVQPGQTMVDIVDSSDLCTRQLLSSCFWCGRGCCIAPRPPGLRSTRGSTIKYDAFPAVEAKHRIASESVPTGHCSVPRHRPPLPAPYRPLRRHFTSSR